MSDGELIDVVDDEDRLVCTSPRRHMRERNLWHRTVAVLCENSLGEIYVQRRSDGKDLFPGQYDMFTSGCLAAGEGYDEAAQRELLEELGISGAILRPLFKHRYDGSQTRTHTWLYRTCWDGPIHHQDGEVAWGGFVPLADVIANCRGWTFVADGAAHFAEALRRGVLASG